MSLSVAKELASLPTTPGLYFYRDKAGEIIYIGKAANLRNRVRQYFHPSTLLRVKKSDPKTDALIAEIATLEWRELDSEADALFLEAELIRRYQPRYNIMLRDDKSLLYVRIDYDSDYPTVSTPRRPLDDDAHYFGPYLNGFALKKALRYLRRAFPYATGRQTLSKRASLDYHLGLDPGLEDGHTTLAQYRVNLRKLMRYLRGERAALVKEIERTMRRYAKAKNFEAAARARNQLFALRELRRQILFGDKESLDLTLDEALAGLALVLALKNPPRRIEAFDISHFAGRDTAASMVVFTNGVPDKIAYRKFKMRVSKNDDTANMKEVVSRRFSERNLSKWSPPQLVVIDGGKGQLAAAIEARDMAAQAHVPTVGLAKRYEEIVIHKSASNSRLDLDQLRASSTELGGYLTESGHFISIVLPENSPIIKLLQRIRDESHRFAAHYHDSLKRTRQTASLLDDVPGIGPMTRKKLIRHFGSTQAVLNAASKDLTQLLGSKSGQKLYQNLHSPLQPAPYE